MLLLSNDRHVDGIASNDRVKIDKAILLFAMHLVFSCTNVHLPYKNKKEIAREFEERYYYDLATRTGFRKNWSWRFLSKKDAIQTYRRFGSVLHPLISSGNTVYAGTRKSFDNTDEYCLVFRLGDDKKVDAILAPGLQSVASLIYNIDYSYQNLTGKNVKLFYAHDKPGRSVMCVSVIRNTHGNNTYVSVYLGSYNDPRQFLKQLDIWDKNRIEKAIPTYSDALDKYGPDTLFQVYGFVSQNALIRSIDMFDKYESLDIYKKAESALVVNGQLSYQNGLETVKEGFSHALLHEDRYVDLQVYQQTKAAYCTFLSAHKEAIAAESIYKNTHIPFELPRNATVTDARTLVISEAAERKIIAFNEAHHDVRSRAFVYSLLDTLKALGFTHIAFEDLIAGAFKAKPGFQTGYYCREPLMYNLITHAQKIGLNIIAYEQARKEKDGRSRDERAARSILKSVRLDKNDRLIIFCGYGHIDKAETPENPGSLVEYIWKFSNIEPLTVDLAYPRIYYLKNTVQERFYSLHLNNKRGGFHTAKGTNGDIAVYPPNISDHFDYSLYTKYGLLDVRDSTFRYPGGNPRSHDQGDATVYVYPKGGDHRGEIPVYTALVGSKKSEVRLFVPYTGMYDVEIRDPGNKILYQVTLTIN